MTTRNATPRIDFYVLPDAKPKGRPLLACRLTEKALAQGYKVFIHTASREQSKLLDELLWTYRDISFIPHAVDEARADEPVLVSHSMDNIPEGTTVLINLGNAVPSAFERFERVTELVDQSDDIKLEARTRFRDYRDRGFSPQTHNL